MAVFFSLLYPYAKLGLTKRIMPLAAFLPFLLVFQYHHAEYALTNSLDVSH